MRYICFLFGFIGLLSCSSIRPGLDESRYFNEEFTRYGLAAEKEGASIQFFQLGMYKSTSFNPRKNMEEKNNPGLEFKGKYPQLSKELFQDYSFYVRDTINNESVVRCSYYQKDIITHYSNTYQEKVRGEETFQIDIEIDSLKLSLKMDLADSAYFTYKNTKIYLKNESIHSSQLFFKGYLFEQNKENIGAIHLGKEGLVWVLDGLDENLKLILISIYMALFSHPDYYFL